MRRGTRSMLCVWLTSLLCVCAAVQAWSQASAPSDPKQDSQIVKPEAIQGCYELTLSPWFPDLRLGEDEQFITPPRRIQLFATRGTEGPETEGYVVRPAPGIKPSIHSDTYWVPKGAKSLEIVFTTGFSGLTMQLKTSDAETLHGKATTFWDFRRPKQIAEVAARRVACEKP